MKPTPKPLAACLAALFGATSFNVWSAPPAPPPVQNQNAEGGTGQPATDTPAASVMPAPLARVTSMLPPAQMPEFPGIPWGSFLLYPDVSLTATYDDNIYAERRHPTEDLVYTLSPSLELKSKWARHALNFGLGADLDRYRNNTSENVDDYWAGFDGRYDLGPRSNVFGGARHSRDHEDRSTAGALNPAAQAKPTRYDHDEAHLGVAHAFGRFTLRAGATWDRYDYLNGVGGSGNPVNNDYRDHQLSSLAARLGYALSPTYEVFGQFATDVRDYDNRILGQSFNRDSDGYRAAAGVKFTLAPQRVAGEAFAGVMRQNYDYSGFADLKKPYFGATVAWKPTSLLTTTAFVDRTLEETTVFSGGNYASGSLDTTYGVEIERRLSSRLTVGGRAAYTKSDFQNFDRSDTIIDAGAGLRYYVMPQVYVGADLRVTDRDSSDRDAQYSRNQIFVSVGYTPARNRDYSIIPEREAGAPAAPRAQGTLSGFYLGAQLGHGGLTTATSGPRGGGGSDTADMGGFGASYGLFGGWGTEINNWYLGVEVDVGDSDAGWYHRKDKTDSRTMFVDQDTSYGASLRVGYQLDGGLLVASLGVVRTDFHTYYTENQYAATGAFNRDHTETGTRFGLGMEIPASRQLFVRTDYRYTDYGSYAVTYQSGPAATTTEDFDTGTGVFSIGLGWRFGGARPDIATRSPVELRGLYAGASLGHGTMGTKLTGTHKDNNGTEGPFDFTGDFANAGFTGGFFAGYGHTFGRVYAGLELDAEASNLGWYHARQTSGGGGRDFAVEKRGSYSGNLRIGYVLENGGLLYARAGAVRTRFNTIYEKGSSSTNWIDRSDKLDGIRLGLGAEIPASDTAFVRMDYSYTRYGDSVSFVTNHNGGSNADAMNFDNRETLFRLGLGFRF